MLQLNADMLELLEADPQKFQQFFIEDKPGLNLSNSIETGVTQLRKRSGCGRKKA